MGTVEYTSQSAERAYDSATFFLTGDLLSRAEERAGGRGLRASGLLPPGPSPEMKSYFFCSRFFCSFFRRLKRRLPWSLDPNGRCPIDPGTDQPRELVSRSRSFSRSLPR